MDTREAVIARAEQLVAGIAHMDWPPAHDIEGQMLRDINHGGAVDDHEAPFQGYTLPSSKFIAAAPQLVRDLIALLRAPQEPGWRAYVQHKVTCGRHRVCAVCGLSEHAAVHENPTRHGHDYETSEKCTCGLAEIIDPPSPAQAEETP